VSSHAGPQPPHDFERALESLRRQRYRPELTVDEAPAPQRLAPHAVALTAEILDPVEDDADALGTGRLVVLHDPAGVESWQGTFRVVTFARATLEADLATDPLIASVAWTWLREALDDERADHHALGGTVTRVTSESFGSLEGADQPGGHVEIRASWTPSGPPDDLGAHARAWAGLLTAAAGLLPTAVGVTPLGRTGSAAPGLAR
jgi:hypothetical protein